MAVMHSKLSFKNIQINKIKLSETKVKILVLGEQILFLIGLICAFSVEVLSFLLVPPTIEESIQVMIYKKNIYKYLFYDFIALSDITQYVMFFMSGFLSIFIFVTDIKKNIRFATKLILIFNMIFFIITLVLWVTNLIYSGSFII